MTDDVGESYMISLVLLRRGPAVILVLSDMNDNTLMSSV